MEAHLTVIFKNKPLWYIAAKIHWNTLETLICYVFVTVYKIWHSIQPCPNNSPSQGLGSIKFQPWGIPLVAAVCNIVILISYCSVLKRLCWLLHGVPYPRNRVERRQMNEANPDGPSLQFHSQALESSITQSLPISQFKKNNEEQNQMHTDCAVCLGEFEEGEWLKHLPNCTHTFHVSRIDTWFQSHSNCSLCRAHVYDFTIHHEYSFVSVHTLKETLRRKDSTGLGPTLWNPTKLRTSTCHMNQEMSVDLLHQAELRKKQEV